MKFVIYESEQSTEHRTNSSFYKKLRKRKNIREKYFIDYYFIVQGKFVSCIDIHLMFISIIKKKHGLDWKLNLPSEKFQFDR